MNTSAPAAIAATALLSCLWAHAESLRCAGGSVAEGDSRVAVVFKCGQPLLKDSFCAPVVYRAMIQAARYCDAKQPAAVAALPAAKKA
jgi:Protein of unknown function (DUF2845)